LIGDVEPADCDHAGACWSSNLDMRCPRCGSRLFLPPRHLARRPEEIIDDMHRLWCAAGWPEFVGGHWSIVPGGWTVIQHPLFAHVGGLPVRHDKLAGYTLAADSYPPRGNGHQPGVEVRQ
jgi:DNA-directed RNA polymerase subunit RPC12/RpoP